MFQSKLVSQLRLSIAVWSMRARLQSVRIAAEWISTIRRSGLFDEKWYLDNNPDVREANVDPIRHFVKFGVAENRSPFPGFEPFEYWQKHAAAYWLGLNPMVHHVRSGKRFSLDDWHRWENTLILTRSGYFDESYYLAQYPDVREGDMSAVEHYFFVGWALGYNPSRTFDTEFYLDHYPDIRNARINPLLHYVVSGRREGRLGRAAERGAVFGARPPSKRGLERQILDGDYEAEESHVLNESLPKVFAFYLPQFHRIPENDEWWGEGFTEWTNTEQATPLFDGQYQPRRPHPDIGLYDLSDFRVLHEQAKLAKRHGIAGFCFYHYWFDGKRLLEKPVDLLIEHPEIDISFCLAWANENWSRRWDGFDSEILIAQHHSAEDDIAFIEDLRRYLVDPRYLRIAGAPVVLVYRADLFPDIRSTTERWRDWARENGIGELYLMCGLVFGNSSNPSEFGFDATFEFPPNQADASKEDVASKISSLRAPRTAIFSYRDYVESLIYSTQWRATRAHDHFRNVMLAWDNTPRRGDGGSHVFTEFSFEQFCNWLKECLTLTLRQLPSDRQLVFVNAWNEWAEGTYLEPDEKYGYQAINSVGRVLSKNLDRGRISESRQIVLCADSPKWLDRLTRWLGNHTHFEVEALDILPDGTLVEVAEDRSADRLKKTGEHSACVVFVGTQIEESISARIEALYGTRPRAFEFNPDGQIDETAESLLGFLRSEFSIAPAVSVIVPNFNHARYLESRLETIFGQTFKDIEVVLLDDCSSDESVEVLERYAAAHSAITHCIFNTENSGNPFLQWKRGLEVSSAGLVWVAESDDAVQLDFLETLVPEFCEESVRLAHCTTVFVDEHGEAQREATEAYYARGGGRWGGDYTVDAETFVESVFGFLNVIPNVSATLFRRPASFKIFDEAGSYQLCGDWLVYLDLIRGGRVVHNTSTENYFRRASSGITQQTMGTERYVEEHTKLWSAIVRRYHVEQRQQDAFVEQIAHVCDAAGYPLDVPALKAELGRRTRDAKDRLNVLIVTQGFFLGGGEVAPIHLANELHRRGHGVIMLSLDVFPDEPSIRRRVNSDIPVYRAPHENLTAESFGQFLSAHRIDLVNSHGHGSDLFVLDRVPEGGLDAVWAVSMHGGYEDVLSEEMKRTDPTTYKRVEDALRRQLNLVDRWLYIADKNLEPLKALGHDVLANCVKVSNGMPAASPGGVTREELGIPESAFVLCCASRAIPEKGWHDAVELTNALNVRGQHQFHLLLIGDGPMMSSMRAEVTDSNVHFLGFKPNVTDYFAMSDLGVLLSTFRGESLPLMVVECLSTGRPVLATDIGEIRMMLQFEYDVFAGELVALTDGRIGNENLGRAAEWVHELASTPDRQDEMRQRSFEAFNKFSIEKTTTHYLQQIDEALWEKRGARTTDGGCATGLPAVSQ